MVKDGKEQNPWYIGGLHFECIGCGNCCAGPEEGCIWITGPEIKLLAEYLGLPISQLRKKYLRGIGSRTTIIEEKQGKDCVFLRETADGKRNCRIYPVRPNQCRTWPFWTCNLSGPDVWNTVAMKCPGINRGGRYTFEQIEKIRQQKKWWDSHSDKKVIEAVKRLYDWIDKKTAGLNNCRSCGLCCDFETFDHRLYISTPEFLYFRYGLGSGEIQPMLNGVCPYNKDDLCGVYDIRFAACRIFSCAGDKEIQNRVSEQAIRKLADICRKFSLPYEYRQLSEWLSRQPCQQSQAADTDS